jgi:hypothetical protein
MQLVNYVKNFILDFPIKYLVFFALCLILLHNCNGCEDVRDFRTTENNTKQYDSLSKSNSILKLKLKTAYLSLDSITLIKQKVILSYRIKKVDVLTNLHDTVSIIQFVSVCDSVINADSLVINKQDSIIKGYENVTANYNSMLSNLNDLINNKDIDLKLANKEIKRQKRTKGAIIIGAIGGLVAGLILN